MIPLNKLFMLKQNEIINQDLKNKIQFSSYSKIPIYKVIQNDIVGYIKTKNLI